MAPHAANAALLVLLGMVSGAKAGAGVQHVDVDVDVGALSPFSSLWRECVGTGHAALWSRADWREHLKIVSQEIGFRFLRGHGILDNSVMFYDACPNDGQHTHVYPPGHKGDTQSCIPEKSKATGSYWDAFSAIDYMLSLGIRPILELSFTPNPVVENWQPALPNPPECDHFHYDSCETPPSNLTRYGELIRFFGTALAERYGIQELEKWMFEVYNEADLHWAFEDYASMYMEAAGALKNISSGLQVGGPASAGADWIGLLMEYCRNSSTALDFVSTHAYPSVRASVPNQLSLLRAARAEVNAHGQHMDELPPLLITEWSSGGTQWMNHTPPMHDDYQMGAWLLAAELSALDDPGLELAAYSYWAISDVFTEQGLPHHNISFWGNWGLLNVMGVRKPSFRLFQMLADASGGGKVARAAVSHTPSTADTLYALALLDGEGVADATTLTLLLANHDCPVLWCPAPPPMQLFFTLRGLPAVGLFADDPEAETSATVATVVRINSTSANPKAAWEAMGAPDYPSPKQLAAIHAASVPLNETVPVTVTKGGAGAATVGLANVLLEPYSVIAVTIRLHVLAKK